MATKVKALQSLAGDYGNAVEGDELELNEAAAKQLEKAGAVQIIGATSNDEKAEDFKASNLTTAKDQEKGLRIHDQTIKTGKTGAEGDTNPKDATGKAAAKKAAPKKSSGKK